MHSILSTNFTKYEEGILSSRYLSSLVAPGYARGDIKMVRKIAGSVAACALSLLVMGQPSLYAQETGALLHLAGRWSGQGTVTPASGPSESFRCIITYLMGDGSAQVRQNLRCHGESYQFDAATRLQISGVQVTGVWTDNIYALTATVSGRSPIRASKFS